MKLEKFDEYCNVCVVRDDATACFSCVKVTLQSIGILVDNLHVDTPHGFRKKGGVN